MAPAARRRGWVFGMTHDSDDRPDQRPGSERAVEEARDLRAAEIEVGVCGQRGGQCRAEEAEDDDDEHEGAHERVPRDEAQAFQQPASGLLVEGLRARDEQEDESEGDEIRRCVDVEDIGRTEERDEDAGQGRPDQTGGREPALEQAVRLGHRRHVLADELGQDHALGGRVRRHERPDRRNDPEQHAERQQAGRVQQRQRHDQRRAREVRHEHRRPGAELLDERAAGHAEDRHRQDLHREDDAHLRRRARRHEHEPRQSQVRHPRAERRDQLGDDECSDRPLVHVLHAGG